MFLLQNENEDLPFDNEMKDFTLPIEYQIDQQQGEPPSKSANRSTPPSSTVTSE